MATSWQQLGRILAGGEARAENAYADELLQSARTDDVLSSARIKRDTALAREALGDAVTKAIAGDPVALATLMRAGMGNWQQVTAGQGNVQQQGFRDVIADPLTTMPARQYAAQALSGRPTNFLDAMGNGEFVDIRAPEAGVQQSPLGDAIIGLREAQTGSAEALGEYRAERTVNPERFRSASSGATPEERAQRSLEQAFAKALADRAGYSNDPAAGFIQAREQLGTMFAEPAPVPAPPPEMEAQIGALAQDPNWQQTVRGQAVQALQGGAPLEDVIARTQMIVDAMERRAQAVLQ